MYSPQATLQNMRLMMTGTVRVSTLERAGWVAPDRIAACLGKDARGQPWTLAAVLAEAWVSKPAPRDYAVMEHVLHAHPGVLEDPHTVGALLAGVLKPSTATSDSSAKLEEAGQAGLAIDLGQRLRRAMQAFTAEQRLQAETVAADLMLNAIDHELRQDASSAIAGWRSGLMDWFDALAVRSSSPGNQGWPVGVREPLAEMAARMLTACLARQERVEAGMQSFKEFEPIDLAGGPVSPHLQTLLQEVLEDTLLVGYPTNVTPSDPRLAAGWQRTLWAVKAFGLLVSQATPEKLLELSERLRPLRPSLEAGVAQLRGWSQSHLAGRRDIDEVVASLHGQGQESLSRLRSVELDSAWSGPDAHARSKPRF